MSPSGVDILWRAVCGGIQAGSYVGLKVLFGALNTSERVMRVVAR